MYIGAPTKHGYRTLFTGAHALPKPHITEKAHGVIFSWIKNHTAFQL